MESVDARGALDVVRRTIDENVRLHQHVLASDLMPVVRAAQVMAASVAAGGKVLAFGNGGSAADAQHLVAELVGRYQRERKGMAAIALSTDTSVITSIANDYGFERIFARQIEALGTPSDVAVAISTSGESPNVIAAIEAARARRLTTVALTGRSGGRLGAAVDIHINVPDQSAARTQEVHRTLIHAICEIVESAC